MSIYRTQPLEPKNVVFPVVVNVNRISGCPSQKEASLEDQHDNAAEIVSEVWDGEIENVEFRVIATKGKGEDLTRPELAEVEAQLKTGEIDLMILDDIGRLVRGTEASRLIGLGVDHGTRTLAPNDGIDTNDEGWEEDVISACRDHVGHNAHTSKRLKQKLMNRFKRKGQATGLPIAGYIKPEDAESYYDWSVDEASTPIIRKGAADLRRHLNCSAIADYFESVGFKVGPYCTNQKWEGQMVRRFYGTAILKGMPERGNMYSKKFHQTGKRRSVKNPEGPVSIEMPHLEILPPAEYDDLNAALDEKNKNRGRKPNVKGEDPLKGVQRKRTRFPGQHAQCWYCGRQLVWGGNGITENLQCNGSRRWECWNSIGFNGHKFAGHVVEAINEMVSELPGIKDQYRTIVEQETDAPDARLLMDLNQLTADEKQLVKETNNFNNALLEYGPSPGFKEVQAGLERRKHQLLVRRASLERKSISVSDLPSSSADLVKLLQNAFLALATDSYEFGSMLPKIVPSVFLYLVRMVDGGPCFPRVKFTVDLTGSFESAAPVELRSLLVRDFTVDLFEIPKRARIRADVIRLKQDGCNVKKTIERLNEPLSTKMIANAVRLNDRLVKMGISDPFQFQSEPPTDYQKLRRHRNPRYKFSMESGYTPPAL